MVRYTKISLYMIYKFFLVHSSNMGFGVVLILYRFYTSFIPVLYRFYTSFIPVLYQFYTSLQFQYSCWRYRDDFSIILDPRGINAVVYYRNFSVLGFQNVFCLFRTFVLGGDIEKYLFRFQFI